MRVVSYCPRCSLWHGLSVLTLIVCVITIPAALKRRQTDDPKNLSGVTNTSQSDSNTNSDFRSVGKGDSIALLYLKSKSVNSRAMFNSSVEVLTKTD
jgi:hypothetical protein